MLVEESPRAFRCHGAKGCELNTKFSRPSLQRPASLRRGLLFDREKILPAKGATKVDKDFSAEAESSQSRICFLTSNSILGALRVSAAALCAILSPAAISPSSAPALGKPKINPGTRSRPASSEEIQSLSREQLADRESSRGQTLFLGVERSGLQRRQIIFYAVRIDVFAQNLSGIFEIQI